MNHVRIHQILLLCSVNTDMFSQLHHLDRQLIKSQNSQAVKQLRSSTQVLLFLAEDEPVSDIVVSR